jgi:hypothetical protein
MKLSKVFIVNISLLVSVFTTAYAQNDVSVLNRIMARSAKLYNDQPIEKVYLHFDKPYYALGDTIWFKAYLTIDRHLPSVLSKIIYVDILGPRDSLVRALKLQVKNSVAWAQIPLSQYEFKKGNYRIVAYTNWMNNADPAYFFNKNITIGNAIDNNVYTQISFKSSIANKQPKIMASIYFKDDNNNPFADKKVNWTVEKDYETILKGKGTTDKNGFININIINNKNYSLDSASMITVLDNGYRKQITSSFPLRSVAKPIDFQFFPEGGSLIAGLPSKIAFKATMPNGLGIDAKGTITDNNNQVVAEFESSHLGMGVFQLIPQDGKTYTANVTFSDGTVIRPDFPKILTGGISLGLDNSDPDVLKLKLLSDQPFLTDNKGKIFFIIGKSAGVICFAAQTELQGQVYTASIPKSKFPTGIAQLTLFSADGDPLSERIAFIQHHDQLNIAIAGDRPAYNTRQKVKLNVAVKNNSQPVEGTFSVAVIDESKVPFDENGEATILTNLLLTSDIKGYIEKPNYYFNNPNKKTDADLDILLQTQGYRRFSYDGILSDKYPPISHLPEQGIDISGTLRASNGIAIKGGNVRLLIADKNYSANAITNEDGRFTFSNLAFTDSTKIKLSARNNTRANDLVLTVDNDPSQKIATNLNMPDEILNIDSVLSTYLKNSKIQFNNSNTLKEVVIKSTRIVPTTSHKDYGSLSSLSSEPDHLIPGSELKDCTTPLDCIRSLAMGMTFDQGKFYVMRDYNQGKRVPVQVFIKGAPVDENTLNTLNANEIESVEIFLKDELGLVNSAYGTNGAIVVNMKKIETTKISLADLKNLLPQPSEVTYSPKGYATVRTFYLPRYSGPRETQTNRTDTRSTIYWNPNLLTDKTGNASMEYYNADGKGSYRVIIEGLDKDGNIGREVYRYTVK